MGANLGAKIAGIGAGLKKDANFSRVGSGAKIGVRTLRAGTGRYFLNKVPVFIWISSYVPAWLLGDLVAGVSVGLVMFPQALMYSALAGVPIQVALTSCWLPNILYAVMGTSKDVSFGPMFFPSIIIGGINAAMPKPGPPPALVAAVLSLCAGIWSALFGFLNLGFLFDALSIPIVLGFGCGMGIMAYMAQVPHLFGMVGVSPMVSHLTGEFISNLPKTNPFAVALGFGTIVFLVVLQKVQKKFGAKNEIVRLITSNRNLFILLLTPWITFMVNKDRGDKPLWLSVSPVETEVSFVQGMSFDLIKSLFFPSFMVWFGIALEHILVAKGLGRMRGYKIDPSQELVHLGISNIANSFMGGLPVGGGDITRASVAATSGVRSPISALFVAGIVAAGMYPLSAFIEYIPLPAVAGIIIVAVIDTMPSPGEMGKYWAWSFADFITFFLTFNGALMATPQMGFELGAGVLVIYTLCRFMSSRPKAMLGVDLEGQPGVFSLPCWEAGENVPPGVCVLRLESDLMYANANGVRNRIVDTAMIWHASVPSTVNKNDRAWSDCRDKRVEYLRKRANLTQPEYLLPALRLVIIDMTTAPFIDASGLHAIEDAKAELRAFAGSGVEFRFVGVSDAVKRRFERAGWKIASPYDDDQEQQQEQPQQPEGGEVALPDYIFDHLPTAIRTPPRARNAPDQVPLTQMQSWEGDDYSFQKGHTM
ncbi:sulfate permease [Colletotrichum camelliae]|nr:sulfate permease [Colletotrichum camelliae]